MGSSNNRFSFLLEYLKSVGLSFVAPTDELIDWRQAAAVAFIVADVEHGRIEESWQQISDEFARMVREVEPELAAFTKLEPARPLGYPVIFDRAEWIVTAEETIKPLVEPIFHSLMKAITVDAYSSRRLVQATATIQIGTVLGYLAKRVLGQYDLPLASSEVSGNGKLYFIYPNVAAVQERFSLGRREFFLWLSLHETTHSYEFESNPWLHSYLNRLIAEHTAFMEAKLKELVKNLEAGKATSSLARLLFTRSFRDLISVDENQTLGRIQAFMAVIEGYSEYVMREVSRKIIPHSDAIASLFERTKRSKTWAERLLERFMGLDIKLWQYRSGRDFIAFVTDRGGIDLANAVWAGPENLPTPTEINQPEMWIKRVGS